MYKIIVLLAIVVSGCASSTGVLKMRENIYQVTTGSSPMRGGISGSKERAYEEATEFCKQKNKEMYVQKESGDMINTNGFPGGTIELIFSCN